MVSKSRLFSKILGDGTTGTIPVESLSTSIPLGVEDYSTVINLPLSGNNIGDQAFVSENNRLYIWTGVGWYSIALINQTPAWDSGGQPLSSYTLDADSPQQSTIISLSATDPEGLPISYSYITGGSMDSMATVSQDSSVITITPNTLGQLGPGTYTGTITFRASDGVNLASALSEFTLSFVTTVENSRYTVSLITTAGTVGNNTTFTDSSSNNITLTPTGNTVLTTVSPHRSAGYTWYFDGSGDYISTATGAITIGTNDFTYEAWIYPLGNPSWGGIVGPAYGANGIVLFNQGGNLNAYGSGSLIAWSGILQLNAWQHVALTRESGVLYLYHNGVKYSSSVANTYDLSNSLYQVGANGSGGENFNGYISDVRVINGTAIYTDTFTPPTEKLTDISGTALLTCHLPYLKDGSSNNHTLTATGNVRLIHASPYDYKEYDSILHGGSLYLDGSGDFLTATNGTWKTFASNDFTIEFWMYPDVTSDKAVFGDTQASGVGDACTVIAEWKGSTSFLAFEFRVGATKYGLNTNANSVRPYTWSHIAFVRYGTSFKTYVNGIQQTETQTLSGNMNTSPNNLFIGNFYSGYGSPFKGYISDFKVSNGTAVYTSNFNVSETPLQTPPSASLHFTGSGANIVDTSQTNRLEIFGNTTTSSAQSKYLASSIYFDGNGDYISTPEVETFKFRTGDFTVEGWIYLESDTDTVSYIASKYFPANDTDGWRLTWFKNGANPNGRFVAYMAGNAVIAPTTYDVNLNEWVHFALSREGSNLRLFTNGTLTSSVTNTTQLIASTQPIILGASGAPGNYLKGYLEDVRITKGLARYVSSFTPPTAPLKG